MTSTGHDPSIGWNAALAATLNGERAASKVSFDNLAAATGISRRTLLRQLSSASRHLTVAHVEAITAALGLNVVEVVTAAQSRLDRTEGASS